MAGLFGAGRNSQTTPNYTRIQLQTSAQGLCIPLGWGRFRASPNLIDYTDFRSQTHKKKGKGGLTGKGSGQKTYSATIMMALCEGPIEAINFIWINQTLTIGEASVGMTLFTGATPQTPWSYMASHHADHALSYAGTAYLCAANYDLGSGATLPQHNFEVFGALHGTTLAPGGDANPGDIIEDMLGNPQYSIGQGSILDPVSLAQYKTYCTAQSLWFSPYLSQQEQVSSILQRWAQLTNSWFFWSGDLLKFVPLGDCVIIGNGVTYTPNCTPVFDLTVEDFIVDGANAAPITIRRSDPADGYNRVVVHVKNRGNYYNSQPIDWTDQASVDQYGVLQAQEVTADEVCDPSIGTIIAQLIGLRATYQRNSYEFKLPFGFVLLEPGDVVTLTEANLGLERAFVRITAIEEDENQLLSVACEEFPFDCDTGSGIYGVSTAYPPAASQAVMPNTGAQDPGNVNPPMLIEPSAALTLGVPQLWVGLSGGANWGGANVWLSFDNTTYTQIGTIEEATVQGVLSALLASHADPDTTNTLSIDLSESALTLPSTATHADADAGRTLALVDSELLAYGTVTPGIGAYDFALTYLRRGLYGTAVASHAIGGAFSQINIAAILTYDLPIAYVGATLYLKFTSFNLFGLETQDLSAVPYYTYIPAGTGYAIAPPSSPALALTTPAGAGSIQMTLSWLASAGPLLGQYEIQFSTDGGSTWVSGGTAGPGATSFALSPAAASTSYIGRVRAISSNGLAVSTWAVSASLNAGVAPIVAGGGGMLLVNGDIPLGIITDGAGQPVYV